MPRDKRNETQIVNTKETNRREKNSKTIKESKNIQESNKT